MKPRGERIGKVVFLSEQMDAARELSSCCIGAEAHLEANAHPGQPPLSHRPENSASDAWVAFRRLIRSG